jgi:hypothetical protein
LNGGVELKASFSEKDIQERSQRLTTPLTSAVKLHAENDDTEAGCADGTIAERTVMGLPQP